jgi:hypothetical protein
MQKYLEIIVYAYATAIGGTVKNVVNVLHFMRNATILPVDKSDIETTFQSSTWDTVLAALSVSYTQTNTTVRFFDDALDAPISFVEAGVGAIAGDRLPDYNAVTIQLRTAFRGKSYRGSKHLGPIAESSTTGDLLAGGAVTLFEDVGAALVAGFTDGNGNLWVPVIRSSKPPAQYRVNPTTVVANAVISYRLNKSLGTMRRRKVRTVN